MRGIRTSRRSVLRRSAAAIAAGTGLAGCSVLPGQGSTPSFTDWFHVRDQDEHDWYANYRGVRRRRENATKLNASYYARSRPRRQDWWNTGVPTLEADWTGYFSPQPGVVALLLVGSFDRSEVGDHVEWRDGEPRGSHDGFDLYEVTEQGGSGENGPYIYLGDAYAVGSRMILGVSVADPFGGGPVTAAREVIDGRGDRPDGTPATLLDRLDLGLTAWMEHYEADQRYYNPRRLLDADAGGMSVALAGDQRLAVTLAYAYEDGSPPGVGEVNEWLDGVADDPGFPLGNADGREVAVEGDVVEITATVTGSVLNR